MALTYHHPVTAGKPAPEPRVERAGPVMPGDANVLGTAPGGEIMRGVRRDARLPPGAALRGGRPPHAA